MRFAMMIDLHLIAALPMKTTTIALMLQSCWIFLDHPMASTDDAFPESSSIRHQD
jgi:hypothetical protein